MASSGVDFLTQYKTISNKLKKRFLRKPNVAEASEQFSYLAKQLQQQECPQYAAFSCLALARCEQTIANPAGEAQALVQGARLFLEEEVQNYDLICPTFNEHLNAAINCYNHAIRVYMEHEHYGLAAALCLELGNALRKCNKTSEAITYYQRGAELVSKSPLECLNAKDLLVTCCIEIGDYDRALALLTEMTQIVEHCGRDSSSGKCIGAFTDYVVKCEVTRVLLLLLLCPGPQRLQPEHSQLLEKYAWEMTDFEATDGTPVQRLRITESLASRSLAISKLPTKQPVTDGCEKHLPKERIAPESLDMKHVSLPDSCYLGEQADTMSKT